MVKIGWLDRIWNALVFSSCFILFTQCIVNGFLAFHYYWLFNIAICVLLYQTLSVKFSRADILRAFEQQETIDSHKNKGRDEE